MGLRKLCISHTIKRLFEFLLLSRVKGRTNIKLVLMPALACDLCAQQVSIITVEGPI